MLVLEYPFRIFLYIAVILVIIGMMWQFRDRIMDICLFPPCEVEPECDVEVVSASESIATKDVLEKYCRLCWAKNKQGECKKDAMCYVVSFVTSSNPSLISLSPEVLQYCSIECSRDATSVFVQYKFLDKEVLISC